MEKREVTRKSKGKFSMPSKERKKERKENSESVGFANVLDLILKRHFLSTPAIKPNTVLMINKTFSQLSGQSEIAVS